MTSNKKSEQKTPYPMVYKCCKHMAKGETWRQRNYGRRSNKVRLARSRLALVRAAASVCQTSSQELARQMLTACIFEPGIII